MNSSRLTSAQSGFRNTLSTLAPLERPSFSPAPVNEVNPTSSLHTETNSGNYELETIEELLQLGAGPYAGQSILQTAIRRKCSLEAIVGLLFRGKQPDPNEPSHQTPVHFLLAKGANWKDIQASLYLLAEKSPSDLTSSIDSLEGFEGVGDEDTQDLQASLYLLADESLSDLTSSIGSLEGFQGVSDEDTQNIEIAENIDNQKYSAGDSLLHFAIKQNSISLEVIQMFIDAGMDPHLANDENKTPLQLAIELKRSPQIILALLIGKTHVPELRSPSLLRSSPFSRINYFHINLQRERTEQERRYKMLPEIAAMLEMDRRSNDEYNKSTNNVLQSHLHFAIIKELDPAHTGPMNIKALLSTVEDINKQYNESDTLLHFTMRQKGCPLEIIEYLFALGANPSLCNIYNQTPLHLLSQQHNLGITKLFIEKINNFQKNADQHYKKTKLINLQDCHGNTALHYYLMESDHELAKTLSLFLEAGASLYLPNKDKKTPLQLLLDKLDLDTVKEILKDNKVNINHQDKSQGNTPLHNAMESPNCTLEIIKKFLSLGADPYLPNEAGQSALQFAVQKQLHPDIILALQLRGEQPDPNNASHQTPVHFALADETSTAEDIEALLYTVKANDMVISIHEEQSVEDIRMGGINQQYLGGNTLIHFALERGCSKEIIEVFTTQKADLNTANKNNEIPMALILEKLPGSTAAESFRENETSIEDSVIENPVSENPATNQAGQSALQLAAQKQLPSDIILDLQLKGNKPDPKNPSHQTPVHFALADEQSTVEDVEALLYTVKEDINQKYRGNDTLLQFAIKKSSCMEKINTLLHTPSIIFKFSIKNLLLLRKVIRNKNQKDLAKTLREKIESRGFFGFTWFIKLSIWCFSF